MNYEKQQILFIGRKIWGGGAEKVMYYLSHRLDRNLFEPYVAYMVSQEGAPVSYDPSIPTYCVDPSISTYCVDTNPANQQAISPTPQKAKISRFFFNKLPASVKAKIKSFISIKTTEMQMRLSPVQMASPEKLEILIGLGNLSRSLATHLTYSYGYKKILSSLRDDAIVVTFQEEPAVQTWLNQIGNSHSYISYLCAPESIHFPLLYSESQRFRIEKWMFSNASRAASYVTVPNMWMRDDMINEFGTPSGNVKVISNPIDCNLIVKKSELPLDLVFDFDGKTIFVQLARLDTQKNHVLTVQACEILKRKYDNFIVLLIGDGSEKSRIEQMVKERDLQSHIIFLGEQSNPYPYLKIARSSILTSDFEASPLALMDAMLLGAVPISVDCICGPSDILGEGSFGLLVPPNDPEKFSEAMLRMALDDDLWQQLKKLGMEHANSFDISFFVDAWTTMLLEIRDGKKSNG